MMLAWFQVIAAAAEEFHAIERKRDALAAREASAVDELTDREALEQLLARFGLEPYAGGGTVDGPAGDEIVLVAKEGGVEGYNDFQARFRFDDDGKFETLGIWE